MMPNFRLLAWVILILFALPQQALADEDPIYTSFFSDTAVSGYDTVAYHTEGKAVEGNDKFSTEWMDADWYFVSAANRDLFVANPEKYAPQYGGYCAYAVAMGSIASTDPEQWAVVDGKLYLNYSSSVQRQWSENQANFITDADGNWPSVLR